MDKAAEALPTDGDQRARQFINSGKEQLISRIKHLVIADKHGWGTVEELQSGRFDHIDSEEVRVRMAETAEKHAIRMNMPRKPMTGERPCIRWCIV